MAINALVKFVHIYTKYREWMGVLEKRCTLETNPEKNIPRKNLPVIPTLTITPFSSLVYFCGFPPPEPFYWG